MILIFVIVAIYNMTKTGPFHTLQGLIQNRDQIVVMLHANIATTLIPQGHTATTTTTTNRCETYCQGNIH